MNLDVGDCIERLELAGTSGTWSSAVTDRWLVTDLTELWQPAEQRGADILIPGAAGVLPQPRRNTVTTHDLPIVIVGADRADLWDNVETIRDEIVAPTGTATGTRAGTLFLPDGSTATAAVHVLGLRLSRFGELAKEGLLRVSIPAGEFT